VSTPTTAARAAAEWWAERVGAPVHRLVEHSQRDFSSDFAELSMLVIAAENPVPEGAAAGFVDALEKLYDELLVKWDGRVSLGVDYGPDMELAAVAKAHGIHPARFPIKTNLWAYPDHVVASLGYRGQHRLVWSAPDWERPVCHSLDHDGLNFGTNWCTKALYHDGDHGGWEPDPRRCKGCGLSEGGHYDRPRVAGDFHQFEARAES
jgi:hypothetical protein